MPLYGPAEHWFLPDGTIIFCDGDVSAEIPNHDLVVVEHLNMRLISRLEDDQCLFRELAKTFDMCIGDTVAMREHLLNWFDQYASSLMGSQTYVDDPEAYLKNRYAWSDLEMAFCFGTANSQMLPREYAVRKWGWIRQRLCALEIQKTTKTLLQRAAKALYEVYGSQVYDAVFAVDISGSRRFYLDVPYDVFARGSVQALRAYAGHRLGGSDV